MSDAAMRTLVEIAKDPESIDFLEKIFRGARDEDRETVDYGLGLIAVARRRAAMHVVDMEPKA